jgi:arylsulfatase
MATHPNILMVLADQHNAGWLGCAGHAQARTPNLDAFAASGVRFANAYAQNTICTPARISILSGQYCHNHGYYGLSGPSAPAPGNLFRHLRAHGYRTAGYGKLHLPTSPRNWVADDVDAFGDTYEMADGQFGRSRYLDELEQLGLRDKEDSWHNVSGVYGPGSIHLDAMPSKLPYAHTQEVWCARQALRFIDAAPDTPFCIQVAFQRPHHPLLPQARFWDLYPEDIALPDALGELPAHRAPHFRTQWTLHHDGPWEYGADGEEIAAGFRRAWRGTMACVSQVDDVFGMLLQGLEDRGLAGNTLVLYSSDHGAYHGIHGLREKAPGICSDAVCRVPLLWRVPDAVPAVRDALVEAVDLAPTLVSLCGLPPMDGADGVDVTPLLRGDTAPVRRAAVTENPWSKAIRWDRWRLVHYPRAMFDGADEGELYDLDADPGETRNLYHDPAARDTVAEGRRLLMDWLIETTRTVTTHPAVYSRPADVQAETTPHYRAYPLVAGNRAPNPLQPRFREDNSIMYL